MVKFETNGKHGNAIITLPTRIDEITPEYLKAITSHIRVADNYSLIALCHKEKLSNFVIAGRNNKGEMSTAVIPLFVKTGYSGTCFIDDITAGSKLIISPSALSLGNHVTVVNNDLTMSKFSLLIDGDKAAMTKALGLNTDVYFMEYKIIPNNEIVGYYKPIEKFNNPFKIERVQA